MLQPLQKSTLATWFATPRGQYVLQWELAQIGSAVEDVFGFRAMQIGLPEIDLLRENRIPFRFCVAAQPGCIVAGDPAQLPIASASVDLVVLPHVLEFSANPHQILREAERILLPEGQLVIAGFNPISLWGLKRKLSGKGAGHPWTGEFISLLRLRDWLKLLGFELNGGKFGCYAPPFAQAKWLRRWQFMELAGDRWWPIAGGVYVVRAVKRNLGMRLVTPAWRNGRSRAPALAHVARREPETVAGHRAAGAPNLRLIIGGADDEKRARG